MNKESGGVEEEENDTKKMKTEKRLDAKESKKLFEAIKEGNSDQVRETIDIMDDIDQEVEHATALCHACRYERVEIVQLLLSHGCDYNKIDDVGYSPLMIASDKGHVEIVRILLSLSGINLNYEQEFGMSSLSIAAAKSNNEIVDLLINSFSSFGIDISHCAEMALICATENGNVEIVKRLIELGVNVNFINSDKYTSPVCMIILKLSNCC